MLQIKDVKTEYRSNPIGLDAACPRFSWKLESDDKNVVQSSWRIIARQDTENGPLLWDSGVQSDAASQRIRWEGSALTSAQRVAFRVTVTACGDAGTERAESDVQYFEMGLLSPEDWKGEWIEPVRQDDYQAFQPAPYLRKTFAVKSGLVKARIYQTAHGLYAFWLNGLRGTEDLFKPGYTSYHKRLQYQVYDITGLLKEGENVWSVALGDGWWRGTLGGSSRNNFGYRLQFLGQIHLTYADGTQQIIPSDEAFRYSYGGIQKCDIRDGEIFDAGLEPEDWKQPGFDDAGWEPVQKAGGLSCRKDHLIASRSVPVRTMETFEPREFNDAAGNRILDFGQNLAGFVKMRLRGLQPGQEIILTHGEDLKDGVFSLGNLLGEEMFAQDHFQEVRFIAKGVEAEETFCPTFSVFGFRYVKLEGYESEIRPGDFTAYAVYSALEETGDFTCSNLLINQLVKNSRWSQKSNYLDVPTDCPTRERSPWTGDSQVYCRTAADFMNVYPFFEKWMQDFTCDQAESGKLKSILPKGGQNPEENERVKQEFLARIQGQTELSVTDQMVLMMYQSGSEDNDVADGSSGWSDAAVINPWTMYLCYGDPRILENQYVCMKKHVDYMFSKAKNPNPARKNEPEYRHRTDGELDADYIWDTEFHWGEWLEADVGTAGEMERMIQKFTNPDPEVPTGYLYYSTKLFSEMARILGNQEDAVLYGAKAEKVKCMFNRYLIRENGQIKPGRQAPAVRALAFDLCDETHKAAVQADLAKTVEDCGMHLNTGFLATPYLLDVLCDAGRKDLAFALLEQEDAPSWLYNVKKGATTILEEWCGMDTHTGSFNHYSYGAVCNFLFERVAGIRPVMEDPGYHTFEIAPLAGGTITRASAEFESLYGTIRSAWEMADGQMKLTVEVPANTTAVVRIPAAQKDLEAVRKTAGNAVIEDGYILCRIGSGVWLF